jgi:catechol 2,3-dioxygenase-like lactoylglutathione lyase family enzyme
VFDHVTIRVSDLAASEAFYSALLGTLGVQPAHSDDGLVEWENDFSIAPADAEHPVTRNLHIAWFAPSRDAVQAFWQAGVDAGHRDDGAPGPRPQYGPDYYGGFLLDPDGNSAEAVVLDFTKPRGAIDHLWIRVADGRPTEHVHLAFAAPDDATVDAFHRAATEAGYRDHGAPGERPEYHAGYYGAYVLDPDGNNVEAVNHDR